MWHNLTGSALSSSIRDNQTDWTELLTILSLLSEVNGSLEVAVMHISEGEFLALIFVLWENHGVLHLARRTRMVQIIKM